MYVIKSEQQKADEKKLNCVNGNYFSELVSDNPPNPNPPKETPRQAITRITALCKKKGWPLPAEAN